MPLSIGTCLLAYNRDQYESICIATVGNQTPLADTDRVSLSCSLVRMINQLELKTPDDSGNQPPPSYELSFSLLKLILLAIESIVRAAFPPSRRKALPTVKFASSLARLHTLDLISFKCPSRKWSFHTSISGRFFLPQVIPGCLANSTRGSFMFGLSVHQA